MNDKASPAPDFIVDKPERSAIIKWNSLSVGFFQFPIHMVCWQNDKLGIFAKTNLLRIKNIFD